MSRRDANGDLKPPEHVTDGDPFIEVAAARRQPHFVVAARHQFGSKPSGISLGEVLFVLFAIVIAEVVAIAVASPQCRLDASRKLLGIDAIEAERFGARGAARDDRQRDEENRTQATTHRHRLIPL